MTIILWNMLVVVDAMIRQWVTVVAPMEAGAEGLGGTIQELANF